MTMTQLRDVSHCEPSPYVKLVTIKSIEPAQNSDFLNIVEFEEMGQNAISKRGEFTVGSQVMFIPPDSVLPFELTELLGITKYTNKGRIRVTKLRGNRSEGVIVDKDVVEPQVSHILKWEDPPTIHLRGCAVSQVEAAYDFLKFYKMPNILNEPFTFKVGEEIWYSEKIHGTNMRFGVLPHPHTNEYTDYVGSRNVVLKESETNLYWNVYDKFFRGRIPRDYVFFCEPFGPGIQHLTYGRKGVDVRIFAIMHRCEYLPVEQVIQVCTQYHLPVVEFKRLIFKDLEEIRSLADAPSEITTEHFREGIVMVSAEQPNRMAKCIGFTYLTEKEKKRTERH